MLSGDGVAGLTSDGGVPTARAVLGVDEMSLSVLLESVEAAWADLADFDTASVSNADRRAVMVRMEKIYRSIRGTSHAWLTHLIDDDGLAALPESRNPGRLASLLRIDAGVAGKRIKAAGQFGPRQTMTGEQLEPLFPTTAAAHRDGDIDAAHTTVIVDFFDELPAAIDHGTRVQSEIMLGNLARILTPENLKVAAQRLLALLDPDGKLADEKDPLADCYVKFGRQDARGLTKGTFVIDAETRAYLEAGFSKLAKPGMNNPDDPKPVVDDNNDKDDNDKDGDGKDGDTSEKNSGEKNSGEGGSGRDRPTDADHARRAERERERENERAARRGRDTRSQGRRNHDALKTILRQMLASGTLGEHRGLPVTAVISMTLAELEEGCGHAVTGTGSLVPMRDAIRMASHARHYLAIFDDHGRALYLGRSKRLASADQRIVLLARDRGCTFPGCSRPATWCQTHHMSEWEHGGDTDIDSLTFGCDVHHRLVGDGPNMWATTTTGPGHRYPGRTQWHPPVTVDPDRRGMINHFHHPNDYLYTEPDDPEP